MSDVPRLLVAELTQKRPSDLALGVGLHELRDAGVELALGDCDLRATSLGFGPTAFLLPGARRLARGAWATVEDSARISYAGREWVLVRHMLAGDSPAVSRGVCLNPHAPGFPARSALLCLDGTDRGNFWRLRTEPVSVAPGVTITALRAKDGSESLTLRVQAGAPETDLRDTTVAPGSEHALNSGDVIALRPDHDSAGMTLQLLVF
jgi:hypothetical protein